MWILTPIVENFIHIFCMKKLVLFVCSPSLAHTTNKPAFTIPNRTHSRIARRCSETRSELGRGPLLH